MDRRLFGYREYLLLGDIRTTKYNIHLAESESGARAANSTPSKFGDQAKTQYSALSDHGELGRLACLTTCLSYRPMIPLFMR